MRRLYTLVIFSVLFIVPMYFVDAAHMYMDADDAQYGNLDTFYVPLRIKLQEDECINLVKASISYNPSEISVQDISISDSILSIWTQKPSIKTINGTEVGIITFEGGIPGGYCGRIVGDPGKTDVLVKLVVTGALNTSVGDDNNYPKTTHITIEPNTKVYLNDGFAGEANLSVAGINLVLNKSTTTPNNIWLSDIRSDNIAPELFDVVLIKGPSVGNQRHYIIFSTIDKQSGIDHYEVLETDPDRFGFLALFPNKESHWVIADSPYVLRDQKLHSKIMVKAVDKNGNDRIVEYTPPMSAFVTITQTNAFVPVLVIVFLILIFTFIFVRKQRKNKKEISEEKEEFEEREEFEE